ncbi:MAG: ATP-binding protein [Acidobacteriota bacterium]
MALKFEQKLPVILSIVFLLITVIGFILYQNTTSVQDAVDREQRTQRVLTALDKTLVLSLDIESATRRFIVTSNDSYLEKFNRAKQQIGPNIAELRRFAEGNEYETAAINKIEPLLNSSVQEAQRKIDLRKSSDFESTAGLMATSADQNALDELRVTIDGLKEYEFRSMEARDAMLDESFYSTIWTLIIGSVAGLAALGFANYVVSREIGKRRLAETALTEANHELEDRIEKRTAELQDANDRLLAIAGEREELLTNEQMARQEAEIANRLRDEFLATASHELRTPINSILGWARLLKAGNLDSTKAAKGVNTIIKNSEIQSRLIQDLMDVARVISGKLELERQQVDPAEIIKLAVESIRPAASQRSIEVTLSVDPAPTGLTIIGDRDRLMQVFSNLLTNAVKFTPSGGKVMVDAFPEDGVMVFRFSDTGSGISAEFLPHVFERFRQDSSAIKGGGLGLGLAIVRNISELHGGTVSVQSEGENKGSVFTVKLPLEDGG